MLLAAARTPDGVALFEVDPLGGGVTRAPVTAMDTTRHLAVVRLAGAPGRPSYGQRHAQQRGRLHRLARARDLACIALSAEQVGAAQRALELTVAHARPGSSSASPSAVSRPSSTGWPTCTYWWSRPGRCPMPPPTPPGHRPDDTAAGDAPDLSLRAAAAKAYCSEVLLKAAGEMIQLHGAIGITWEHDAHRYLKRAHGAAQLFGQPGRAHRQDRDGRPRQLTRRPALVPARLPPALGVPLAGRGPLLGGTV